MGRVHRQQTGSGLANRLLGWDRQRFPHAAASYTTSRRGDELPLSSSLYLGPYASVADAERAGLVLSLEMYRDRDMLLLLTDSTPAFHTI